MHGTSSTEPHLRRVDSDMHSRSIGLLAGNFVDVDDEFLTIASDDTATVTPMTNTGNDNSIIDSKKKE